MTQKELIYETETDSQDTEDRLVVAKGQGVRERDGLDLEFGTPPDSSVRGILQARMLE